MKDNPFDLYTEEYEDWFANNTIQFKSEVLALQHVIPSGKKGVEIGIGSGIFAEQLGVKFGIDPSENMLNYARQRSLNVVQGFAENLPYSDNSFDFAVFITSMCFITDPSKALKEAHRVINPNGEVIIAFIDRESSLGKLLTAGKKDSKFYKTANFYSVKEIIALIESNNFEVSQIFQTLTDLKKSEIEKPLEGSGKGGFVVIKAAKR